MAVVKSTDLHLPTDIADGIVEKAKTGSSVAALSGQEPMRFGKLDIITFDDDLTAEFVEESGAKGSDDAKPDVKTAVPHKALVQMRTSDEFLIADEDYQLHILNKYEEKCGRALARGLDLGLYYRTNPRTGNPIPEWTNYLNATTKRVEITATSQADIDFEAAAGLVIGDGYSVNGVAFDPKYAWKLSTARYADGRKKYPELGLGGDISSFEGVPAAVSSTVSAKAKDGDTTDNKVRAVLGNFHSGIRWGVQRSFPFKILEYGDPDNTGRDLAGHNEILLRAEIIYGWYVFDGQFAVIEDAVTP
ncbi:MAG: phage major capsid protein [Mycobacterium sp.]